MTGYLRLGLAALVLLSHTGITINGLNPGVIAVIIFYMLAGGVVTHLWHDILPQGKGKLRAFYTDRILRIFPLYLYIASLTAIFILITGYGSPSFQPLATLSNILIIPLSYFMFIDNSILTDPTWWLIPQAWSLGTELQAYLMLPFILIYKRAQLPVLIISISIYTAANLNIIHTDHYGYRLLPGIFFMFLIGSILKQESRRSIISTPSNWLLLLATINYLILHCTSGFQHVYTQETLVGILIGIPLLRLASATNIKLPHNKTAASLSYGVFLSHFLVIWFLDYSGAIEQHTLQYYAVLMALTLAISYSGAYLVEKRINTIRMRSGLKLTSK